MIRKARLAAVLGGRSIPKVKIALGSSRYLNRVPLYIFLFTRFLVRKGIFYYEEVTSSASTTNVSPPYSSVMVMMAASSLAEKSTLAIMSSVISSTAEEAN